MCLCTCERMYIACRHALQRTYIACRHTLQWTYIVCRHTLQHQTLTRLTSNTYLYTWQLSAGGPTAVNTSRHKHKRSKGQTDMTSKPIKVLDWLWTTDHDMANEQSLYTWKLSTGSSTAVNMDTQTRKHERTEGEQTEKRTLPTNGGYMCHELP